MAVCMSCHRQVVWKYGRYLSAGTEGKWHMKRKKFHCLGCFDQVRVLATKKQKGSGTAVSVHIKQLARNKASRYMMLQDLAIYNLFHSEVFLLQ